LETVIAGFGPRGELPSPLPLPLFSPARPLPPRRAPRSGLTSYVPVARPPVCRWLGPAPGGGGRAPTPGLAPPLRMCPMAAASLVARPRVPAPPRARRRRPRLRLSRPYPCVPGGGGSAPRPRARGAPCPGSLARAPAAWRPAAPRARVPCARPRVASRAPLRLAFRQPCALSVISRALACVQRVRTRATVVARRSTLSFISFSILI
jgi:hypothetical protein